MPPHCLSCSAPIPPIEAHAGYVLGHARSAADLLRSLGFKDPIGRALGTRSVDEQLGGLMHSRSGHHESRPVMGKFQTERIESPDVLHAVLKPEVSRASPSPT